KTRKPRAVSWISPLYPSRKRRRNRVRLILVRQPDSSSQNREVEDSGEDSGIRRENTLSHSRSGIDNALFWHQTGNENFLVLLQSLGLGWMEAGPNSWPFEN